MDFGDILTQWEAGITQQTKKTNLDSKPKKTGKSKTEEYEMEKINKPSLSEQQIWIKQHGVIDKDAIKENENENAILKKGEYLRNLIPEGRIDLHGMTRDKAWIALDRFIDECKKRGFRKVLIVHGKGNHSSEEPVLAQMVQLFIEQDTRLGAHGYSDRSEGGKGSTWVIIR